MAPKKDKMCMTVNKVWGCEKKTNRCGHEENRCV